MARIIDISVLIHPGMVTWDNAEAGVTQTWNAHIGVDGSEANLSAFSIGSHCGTHLDAPLHFVREGSTVDQLRLDDLIGPCHVIEFEELAQQNITAADLEAANISSESRRLIFKTTNTRDRLLRDARFHTEFVAIAPDAAAWIVERGIHTVGVDYLSVGSASDGTGPQTHRILLGAGVVALEGLQLDDVEPGIYTLIALPLKIHGAEGCPMRAVLLDL